MARSKGRILIVEDDTALSDAFGLILDRQGFTVDKAYNGRDALEKIRASKPDLILLDLLMPIMDGKAFLQGFKNTDNIPVIVLSNLDEKSEIQEVLDLGASRYMLKAWASPNELVKLVGETIQQD